MNTKQLQYFLTLTQTKSIAAAARALDIAQPSISQQVTNLEHELGVALFVRSFQGMELTKAGEKFEAYAAKWLLEYNKTKQVLKEFSQGGKHTIKVGMLESIGNVLSLELISAIQAYSDIALDVQVVPSYQMEALLNDNKLDIAITYRNRKDKHTFTVASLIEESMFLIVRKSIDKSALQVKPSGQNAQVEHERSIHFSQLCNYEILTPNKDSSFGQIMAYYESKTGIALKHQRQYSGQLMTGLRQVIQSDMGMILPYSAIYHIINLGQIEALKITQPEMTREVVAMTNKKAARGQTNAGRELDAGSDAISRVLETISALVKIQSEKGFWRGKLLNRA